MKTRLPGPLLGVAVPAGGAVLSAFVFVACFAPAWPRSVWGWLLSAALGIPLLLLGEIIFTVCFVAGPPRYNLVTRYLPSGVYVFRYPAGSRRARAVLLVVRILAAVALCGLVLWLLYAVVLGNDAIRAQFR